MSFKKITFSPFREYVSGILNKPQSSINYMPKWYKDQKIFSNNENNILKAYKKSPHEATYKLCVPLIDSMTAGYMITLPADILVINAGKDEKYIPFLKWHTEFPVADSQPLEVLGNYPIPVGYNNMIFRWLYDWIIKTPKGYSLWITHPSHRHDLPFFTLSAFVDTDRHPNAISLPFFIKEGFEGVIPEGTPIAQIIPIKRDFWKSQEKQFNNLMQLNRINSIKINLIRTYKNKYWSRKKYE